MKKLLLLILILPLGRCKAFAQTTQATIQKQIDSSINANRDVTIFRVNQVSAIQVPGNLHQWNA